MKVERLQGLRGIRLHLEQLPDDGITREVRLGDEWLASLLAPQYTTTGDGAMVRFAARAHDARVETHGTIAAHLGYACSRCAEDFELAIEVAWNVLFLETNATQGELGDLAVAELTDGVADLEPPLSEALVLAMPAYPICRDDCRGRCANCGANKNVAPACTCEEVRVDPRWAKLQDLRAGLGADKREADG